VLDAWPPDARAALAAAVLAVLPGLVLVRAPWPALPALSVATWIVSWTWLLGGTRSRLLHAALPVLAALALLRLVRAPPPWRIGRASVVLAAAVAGLWLLLAVRTVPPGPDMAVEALAAELLAWRDGWPASYEPLVPLAPLRAGGPARLAADVVLLSGAPPHRALLAVSAVTALVLVLGLWSLAALALSPTRAAAVVAIAALATAGRAAGPATLAVALAAQAAALGRGRRGHPSAFAAGACLAAALASDLTSAMAGLVLAIAVGQGPSHPRGERTPFDRDRLRTAILTTAVLAAPLALRPPPRATIEPAPLIALAVVGLACVGDPERYARRRVASALVVALLAALLALTGEGDDLDAGEVAAMQEIRDRAHPLDVVCAPDLAAARWIPSIAARATNVRLRAEWPVPSAPCAAWLPSPTSQAR
jgi:hypothetical protein